MRVKPSSVSSLDVRLLRSILNGSSPVTSCLLPPQPCVSQRLPVQAGYPLHVRRATTRTTKRLKELQQGVIQAEALPEQETDDVPVSVLQGARNNIMKFDNCVVLTRVGNFYELFAEQAEECGPLLSLKVDYRKNNGIAMAGFPFFQLDRFLKILVQDLNKYVAISEEFPTDGSRKERRVTRVVTPGTLIDEKFLNPDQNNFLLAVHPGRCLSSPKHGVGGGRNLSESPTLEREIGLAWLDLSTGDFFTQATRSSLLPSALTRIGAREIILPETSTEHIKHEMQHLMGDQRHLITFHRCDVPYASMLQWSNVLESPVEDTAEAAFTDAEKLAAHQLLDYVRARLQGLEMKLQPPRSRHLQEILSIDRNSMRGLEILETARDGLGKGSLLHAVNRTVTKSGARLLRDRLTSPSASIHEINERLDLVSAFYYNVDIREKLVQLLRKSFDVQRLVQKFALNKGDADDMISLSKAIAATSDMSCLLKSPLRGSSIRAGVEWNQLMVESSISRILNRVDLTGPEELGRQISAAIDEEGLNQQHRLEQDKAASVAAAAQEAVISSGGPAELEGLPKAVRLPRARASDAKDAEPEIEEPWIMRTTASEILSRLHEDLEKLQQERMDLTKELRSKLSTDTLTLKWTLALGHYCHIKNGTKSLPALESLNARTVSSTKSTRSFYLPEWTRLGARIDQATLRIRREEQRLFSQLRDRVIRNLVKLRRNAAVMDELDVSCSFASLAQEQSFVRPVITMDTNHRIIGGRHPTVKLGLEEQGRSFVSNNLSLDNKERIWLVTGPNMAGKSTFLRQNALITILAQVGSYVPAEHAEIGLVDQIFSRIGAADDLFRDQSTFMVEMLESAAILRQATHRSFVIMDEVGRGTTTEDGTAVGYACLHHLYYTNRCRTLFATHFHALADMTQDFQHLGRYCTDIVEDGTGSFSFVHRLRPGVNRQSHALKVARLAGLPEPALEVAEIVLRQLQDEKDGLHQRSIFAEPDSPTVATAGR